MTPAARLVWPRTIAAVCLLYCVALAARGDEAARAVSEAPAAPCDSEALFPRELVCFGDYDKNPVFAGAGPGHWDQAIRERGWILRDADGWRMWYTGYDGTREGLKMLGYATSPDGLTWTRYAGNPLDSEHWIEDMIVTRDGDRLLMFAEGRGDVAHWFTSTDGLHWNPQGAVDVRQADGSPISPGPYGTPTVWREGKQWYLIYERGDRGLWLASSADLKTWTNVQDEPILVPSEAEHGQVAANQVVQRDGRYYLYYHSLDDPMSRAWCTNLAVSTDRLHWTRYPHNPILRDNQSSGILAGDGAELRLYSMHPEVRVHFPVRPSHN
jgi:hypothetical protein